MQEWERAQVVDAYAKGEIKAAVAAARLQISPRQLRRLQQRFIEAGAAGMISGRRGKASNHQLAPGLAQDALRVVREHYADFGPTLACEMLSERHGLVLSKETLRRLMTQAGLWTPLNARSAALHQPRERRASLGELVQIDGSHHEWFERRGPACTVLVYIDDATGRILHLHFAETETTTSYFEATRAYLECYGKPQAFYADRAAVFRSPARHQRAPTQFKRALDELGITLICANSPQAKGRVERANRTLQDRLVKALRLDRVSSIQEANRRSGDFVERYNQRFARMPRSSLDLHTPLRSCDDLARILALRDSRKLSSKLTLQHCGRQYVLDDAPGLRALVGQSIAVTTYPDGRVELRSGDDILKHTSSALPPRAGPIEVDSKTLQHQLDQLEVKRKRNRIHRRDTPATVVSSGVKAAKRAAAQKSARST